jgi:glutamyl-tRNA reductase
VENLSTAGDEVAAAGAIAQEGLARLNTWMESLDAVPGIRKLQQGAESVRQQELEKSLRKLTGLTDDQLAAVDALTRSIVKKLLHEPIKALKESAGRYEPWGHSPSGISDLRVMETIVEEQLTSDTLN